MKEEKLNIPLGSWVKITQVDQGDENKIGIVGLFVQDDGSRNPYLVRYENDGEINFYWATSIELFLGPKPDICNPFDFEIGQRVTLLESLDYDDDEGQEVTLIDLDYEDENSFGYLTQEQIEDGEDETYRRWASKVKAIPNSPKPPPVPKNGDKVRVTACENYPKRIGQIGTIDSVDRCSSLKYRVVFGKSSDGCEDYEWVNDVEFADNIISDSSGSMSATPINVEDSADRLVNILLENDSTEDKTSGVDLIKPTKPLI